MQTSPFFRLWLRDDDDGEAAIFGEIQCLTGQILALSVLCER